MLLPIVLTTRNRSLRGYGGPVAYLDSFIRTLGADSWEIRDTGVRVIRGTTEQRLAFSVKSFTRLSKGTIIDVEVEFFFKAFFAYTISPSEEYAYFAFYWETGSRVFRELLDKQPALQRFQWVTEDDAIFTSLSGDVNDIFGLRIKFVWRPDLFSFESEEEYTIADLRF